MGKQTKDFRQASLDYVDGDPEGAQKIVAQVGYEMGCEYGYQYAIEKIFKCIEDQAIFGWIEDIEVDKFLEKIRKAMED